MLSEPNHERHENEKGHPHRGKEVTINVDGNAVHVLPGEYRVSAFKVLIGVAADRELDVVQRDQLVALADDAEICVNAGDRFVSHGRAGSSS